MMLAALPFYVGLATTAEPLVNAVLGGKWGEVVPVVRLLAFAMPVMTLQVLYSPACDAVGRPDVGVVNGAIGAGLLTVAFLIGVRGGVTGLATAWVVAYPLYLVAGSRRAMPVIGVTWASVARAIAPAALCAGAMALVVLGLDRLLPPLGAVPRLVFLVAAGAVSYIGLLLALARGTVREVVALIRA